MKLRWITPVLAITALLTACGAETADAGPASQTYDNAQEQDMDTYLIERTSALSFDETVANLRNGIEQRPVSLFAEIDHAAGAASADLELAPSTLFIFGNPKGGTPLMSREPRLGIALPLKIHVFESEGKVIVAYEDMAVLAERYGLDPEAQPVPNMIALLEGLAAEATQ